MKKIIIIGCGASGIVASIFAKNKDNEVIILEKNSKNLKKLLITGNGKCNYFNDDFNINHYYSSDIEKLEKIITKENKKRVLDFISNIGITARIKKGYYYPASNQAYSIHNALIKEATIRDVKILNDTNVLNITKKEDKFTLETENGEYIADTVVISTGSMSCPKTGSTGDGYKFGKNFNHKVNKIYPGLVGLISKDTFIKELSGVRSEAEISLYSDKKLKTETGEIQFTENGISGICVYNLSILVGKLLDNGKKATVKINFLNDFGISDTSSFIKQFEKINKNTPNRTITELLEGYLNYKIVNIILKICKIDSNTSWDNIEKEKRNLLAKTLISFNINIIGTKDFNNSQVSVGGISLLDINNDNFESKVVPKLYFTGEVLDVTGDCGGYNLGFAFLSGMIVGDDIKNDKS